MTNHLPMPPYDELSKYLKYDPHIGVGIWLVRLSSRVRTETVAGTLAPSGYVLIKYKQKIYKAHRLFWFLQTKHDPAHLTIDHIDKNKSNNKFLNLRLANKSHQQHNKFKPHNNVSGEKGVCWLKGRQRYQAYIKINGKQTHLGYYKIFEQAVAVRQAKELELYGQFSPLHQLNNDQQLILNNNDQQLCLLGHQSL
jgi:hypothetical protein